MTLPHSKHRLVVIGDSISQGFMSGSICRTDLSYPAMVAAALGVRESFAVPDFKGEHGLPLNLEWIVRALSHQYGSTIRWWQYLCMLLRLRAIMDEVEDYWERGEGARPSAEDRLFDNLSVWGFCLRDAYTVTDAVCQAAIQEPRDNWIRQVPQQAMYRTARRVLNPSFSPAAAGRHQVGAARELAQQGRIENLVIHLGANNAVGAITSLSIRESGPDDLQRLPHECTWNLFRPEHFARHYAELAAEIDSVGAKRVFLATVPHLTIPPVTRGVSPGGTLVDGYYEFYTRPWVWDDEFDPRRHPHLTRDEARKIDAYVDQYNQTIRETAAARGWHVFDACELADRLAFRRAAGKPPYEFPAGLVDALRCHAHLAYLVDAEGRVRLDTRFLMADRDHPDRLSKGGLVSLDGIHPTTIGYALAADLLVRTMHEAGVEFPRGPVIDWNAVVRADRLVGSPPHLLVNLQHCLRVLDTRGLLDRVLESFDRAG